MRPSSYMAKKKAAPGGSAPSFYASATYKQWVRDRLAAKKITFEQLRSRMKRQGVSVTTSAISQFLGNLDEPPVGSNTALMPAINRALGIAPPPICDPTDELSQLRDMIAARWAKMLPHERRMLLELARGDMEIDLSDDE